MPETNTARGTIGAHVASSGGLPVTVRSFHRTSSGQAPLRVEPTQGTFALRNPVRELIPTGTLDFLIVSLPEQDYMAHAPALSPAAGSPLWDQREHTLLDLRALYENAATEDWDGYGAHPVRLETHERARHFISLFPNTVRLPEISAEPDGEIAFEWYQNPWHVFSVSVGPDGRLSYAGLFGRGRIHGTEYLTDELPDSIIRNVRRLFRQST